MSRSSSNESVSDAELYAKGIVLILALIFAVWFYAADASGRGRVDSKWVDTTVSCGKKGCTTHKNYMVQLKDSRVYRVFWGTLSWDPMMPESTISFQARGRFISFFGIRISTPDIFDWKELEPPPHSNSSINRSALSARKGALCVFKSYNYLHARN